MEQAHYDNGAPVRKGLVHTTVGHMSTTFIRLIKLIRRFGKTPPASEIPRLHNTRQILLNNLQCARLHPTPHHCQPQARKVCMGRRELCLGQRLF
jgi:hypothetical protein